MKLCKFIYKMIIRNLMLSVLIILIALSSYKHIPDFSSIHWQVIELLFDLMVVVAALHHYKILEWFGVRLLLRCNSFRAVTLVLTLLTAISSMFLTNDVALITLVPLTLIFSLRAKFNPVRLVVIETLAANLGSSFTPLGNPQNLFLYNYFKFSLLGFLSLTSVLLIIAILFIGALIYFTPDAKLSASLDYPRLGSKFKIAIFCGLFVLILLNIAHLVNYRLVTFVVVVVSLLIAPRVLLKIDYGYY